MYTHMYMYLVNICIQCTCTCVDVHVQLHVHVLYMDHIVYTVCTMYNVQVNDQSISDANHDDAAKAFKLAGSDVRLLVQYDPVQFNHFQVQ